MKKISKQLFIGLTVIIQTGIHFVNAQCTLFSEDFASSFGSQFTSNNTGGSSWAFTNSCSASNLAGHSGPGSVIFQSSTVPCQFGNSTSTVSGNLNSPILNISSAGTTTLNFNYYLVNQCTGVCPNDILSVAISTNGGGSYTTIMDSYSVGGLAPTAGVWVAKSHNLSAYAGQNIMIRFSFNSVNGTANAFDGVYIDDVIVTATAGPAMPSGITGSAAVCMNSSATYTISPVTAATTYTWSVPAGASITSGQGTTTVAVAYGTTSGNISVAAVNSCGTSTAKTLSVTVSVPTVTASASSSSICEGDTAQLTAQTNLSGSNFVDNFDPTNISQWSSISGGSASATCGSVSGNALYFDGISTRSATTNSLNVSGGTINFFLKLANGSAPCEDVDVGEEIKLDYSVNGGATWINVSTYVTTLYSTFTSISEPIPAAAQTPNTMFRWRQVSHSGSCCDHWAIDNVNIAILSSPTYNWAPSANLSSPTISNPQAFPTQTTTYTVTITNGCGSTSDTVTLTINPAVTSANAGNDITICEGWTAMLTASGNGGSSYLWSTGQTTASIVVSPSASTTYTLVVSNASGCSKSDEVMVTVNPAPTASAGADIKICSGQTVLLNGSGNGSFSWSPSAGLSCTTCSSPGASPTSTTTYTLTVTNNCGSVSDDITVTVDMASANAGSDATICANGSTILNASGNGNYMWSPATGLSCTACPNPVANPSTTTTYTLMVTSSCDSVSDEVMVTVDSLSALANAGSDITICANGSDTLNATGNGNYSWSPAIGLSCTTCANPVANPSSTTTYTLTVTTSCGSASDDIMVIVDPAVTANAGTDVTICPTSNTTLSATGNGSYLWSPATGLSCTTCASPVANPSSTITYTLSVTGNCGNASDEITVSVDAMATANAGNNITICTDSSTVLSATGNGNYTWAPQTGLSCVTCANPIANPTSTTSYTLTVTNNCNSAYDSVTVTVNPSCLTGINTADIPESEIIISPNPSAGLFVITAGERIYGEVDIEVMSVQGKVIYSERRTVQKKGNMEIDLTNSAAGMYFLKANTEKSSVVRKIIISKR